MVLPLVRLVSALVVVAFVVGVVAVANTRVAEALKEPELRRPPVAAAS